MPYCQALSNNKFVHFSDTITTKEKEECQVDDEKAKNEWKVALTKAEEDEIVKMVNTMTAIFEFIQHNMHNKLWMDPKMGTFEGLPGGLTFIHTMNLTKLTSDLTTLTNKLTKLTWGLIGISVCLALIASVQIWITL